MKNNPFVGPRPYERKDRHNFYGRDREARELRALIVAEREVLFYAQSGAGKTSLLNTMVIPALEEKGFRILPVARVGSDLVPGVKPEAVDNIFVFSAMLTLMGKFVQPQALLRHTLRSFLEEFYPRAEDEFERQPLVLIFDQFEELFTTHRDRWQEAEEFFHQVREALDALPHLGVVFAMREDHVAAMDRYAPLFPRRLRARFRMERLGPRGALAAVLKPAQNAGRPFAPGVAEQLVDNLRQIKAHGESQETGGHSGKTEFLGPFVEPVQLQVVCNRLWANMPEQEGHAIQWEEVEEYGDIDRALTDFYESALDAAMQETNVRERTLRRWFGLKLITPAGTRGLAMQGSKRTAGLPNAAVNVLQGRHLIRADVRAGARWYELAHDRLVEPISASNRAWQEKHQNPLTLAANAWLAADKDPQKLLKGAQLEQAQAQVETNADELTELEKKFVDVSLETVRLETTRRQRLALLGAGVLLIFFAILTTWALFNARVAARARDQAEIASALAIANAETAIAERNNADDIRETLAANLVADLTTEAEVADTPTPVVVTVGVTVIVTLTNTPTPPVIAMPTGTLTVTVASPTPTDTPTATPTPRPTDTPTITPTPTPNLAATATSRALQEQLEDIRATQTVAAEESLPFIDGIVISFDGSEGSYLLKTHQDEQSHIRWVSVGTQVTVLKQESGSLSYGSGKWYLVSLRKSDADEVLSGWLPAEVIKARLLETH